MSWSRHSRRSVPITLSTMALCPSERGHGRGGSPRGDRGRCRRSGVILGQASRHPRASSSVVADRAEEGQDLLLAPGRAGMTLTHSRATTVQGLRLRPIASGGVPRPQAVEDGPSSDPGRPTLQRAGGSATERRTSFGRQNWSRPAGSARAPAPAAGYRGVRHARVRCPSSGALGRSRLAAVGAQHRDVGEHASLGQGLLTRPRTPDAASRCRSSSSRASPSWHAAPSPGRGRSASSPSQWE